MQTLMTLFGICQSRQSGNGMISSVIKSSVYGLPTSVLEALPNGEALIFPSLSSSDDDKAKVSQQTDSLLGIVRRPAAGHGSALQTGLEIR